MSGIKSLAKETAIYGVSSIVGRFLNYLLVPIYTNALPVNSGGYGVITNVYALVALVMVLLTCGMETGFFRFANKGEDDPMRVYSTTLGYVGFLSLTFLVVGLLCLQPIANLMGYGEHPWYLGMMMIVVAIDSFQAIPFAYLRYQKKALKFASLKLLFIFLCIGLNILYYVGFHGQEVGMAFAINLICSSVVLLCLWRELTGFRYVLDRALLRRMLSYSFPILILGIAGILNQVADKLIFPFVYPDKAEATVQLGIYGASSKIAMIMAMLTQAFRFAYEPFVFSKSRDSDSREMYALAMKYFIIFTLLAFLAVMYYLDILKFILGRDYWVGLKVVPIVMAAEMCMGVYFNLSFWYKLTDQTRWGAYFSLIGCSIIIVLNIIFIPRFSYMACAWAGLAGYGTAMLLSYFIGQRKYPINYEVGRCMAYVALAAVFYVVGVYCLPFNMWVNIAIRTVLLIAYVAIIIKKEGLDLTPVLSRFKHK
jgi:O-antigen/teichoic acid export membrane protein